MSRETELEQTSPAMERPDLAGAIASLVRRKKLLLTIIAAGAVTGAGIALLMPTVYTATALIMLPAKPQSLAAAMMGQLAVGGLTGSLGGALNLKDPADLYIGILKSRSTCDKLVTDFHLQQLYSSKTREDARKELLDNASFASGKDSLIRVSVDDRDPKRAADMTNAFVNELYVQNTRVAITESAQRRVFFEQALEQEKGALAKAEDELRATEQKNGVIMVDGQAEALIRTIAQMRAEIAAREVSLERLKMGATAEYPEVIKQRTELTELRQQLSRLESSSGSRRSGDLLIPASQVPKAGLEYVRCLREVKYHEALFEVLAKQYEAARIDEAKESPAIQVLDSAVPPEKKSSPHRVLITLITTTLFGIAGILLICNQAAIELLMIRIRTRAAARQAVSNPS